MKNCKHKEIRKVQGYGVEDNVEFCKIHNMPISQINTCGDKICPDFEWAKARDVGGGIAAGSITIIFIIIAMIIGLFILMLL